MKIIIIFIGILFYTGCVTKGKTKFDTCLIIKDWNETYYIFKIKNAEKLKLQEIRTNIEPGIIVSKTFVVFSNNDSLSTVKVLNTFRKEKVYGDFDKFYKVYYAKVMIFGFQRVNDDVQHINLTDSLGFLNMPIYNSKVDSVIVKGQFIID